MKTIQNVFGFFTILIIFLMIMIFPARAAIVVTDITNTEFNTLISTHSASWSVVYRGGALGVSGSEEIRLARNTSTPQVGGGANTLIGNFDPIGWSATNNVLEILIDGSGNISARANALTVFPLPVVQSFNQILVLLHDSNFTESTTFTDTTINSVGILRDMSANGFGLPGQQDVISITNFGTQAPFSLNGVWSPGSFPNADDQFVQIVALYNTSIPEPSVTLLMGFASFFMLRRKRC